uniref:Uncharacterized protein n=1 Tax=Rhizophora mucronata TaxID=61149 RepID=A0A2P2QGY5_RHIMU
MQDEQVGLKHIYLILIREQYSSQLIGHVTSTCPLQRLIRNAFRCH